MKAYKIFTDRIEEIKNIDQGTNLDVFTNGLPKGLYTTFRTFDHCKKAIDLRFHLNRLFANLDNSINPSVLPPVLLLQLREILSLINEGEAKVRLILSLTEEPGQVYILIEKLALIDSTIYDRGVKVITTSITRETPREKTTSFILKSEAVRESIKQSNVYEAIINDRNGNLLEGITSNFYGVIDNKIWTARYGILLGVTRKQILRICRNNEIDIVYRPLRIAELQLATEAFLTSSSRGVVPIIQIDNMKIGTGIPGPVVKLLQDRYNEFTAKKIGAI